MGWEERKLRRRAHRPPGGPRTRVRRGKVVEIPEEWAGKVTHPQTIRKRTSKLTRKMRNALPRPGGSKRDRIEARAPSEREWK